MKKCPDITSYLLLLATLYLVLTGDATLVVLFVLVWIVTRIITRVKMAGGIEKFMWQIWGWSGQVNEKVDNMAHKLAGFVTGKEFGEEDNGNKIVRPSRGDEKAGEDN